MRIHLNSRIVRSSEPTAAPAKDSLVMFSPGNKAYYGFNAFGAEIWRRLESPVTVAELCNSLQSAFEGARTQIETDTVAFLTELEGKGLVQIVGSNGSPAEFYRRSSVCVLESSDVLTLTTDAQRSRGLELRDVERRIWEHLEYPVRLDMLVDRLLAEYEGERAQVAKDTRDFLEQLAARGLVELVGREPSAAEQARDRYLGLMKRALTNLLYPEHELYISLLHAGNIVPADKRERRRFFQSVGSSHAAELDELVHGKRSGKGRTFGHTLLGLSGLDNLERCAERLFEDGIEGDFLEAGVLAGGASIFLRALQVAHGESQRCVWLADSFRGLPPPRHPIDLESGLDLSADRAPGLVCDLAQVRENFSRYLLLDDRVRFLSGWFKDTLPAAPVDRLALLRLDGDLYESIRDTLEALYDKVSPGGFIVVDDYWQLDTCRRAVDDYRLQRAVDDPLVSVDCNRVYWRKT